jgi:hypothetical protein
MAELQCLCLGRGDPRPFRVLVIQSDNGAEFHSNFQWQLAEHDVRHVYIRPKTLRHLKPMTYLMDRLRFIPLV